ncbi:MAG: transcriptional regulator [Microbacterium sp.]|nr:transcriptional regulator [Microbacterium sp.]
MHHVAGPARSFAAAERERGWREALADAGITAPEPVRGDWTSASGHRAAAALTAATAVFVANDQMALGTLRAFADAGRRIPDDVAVVGFDDIVDAAEFRPPLTTVRQDFDALGRRVVDALIAAIEGGEPIAESVPAALVVRESSGVA